MSCRPASVVFANKRAFHGTKLPGPLVPWSRRCMTFVLFSKEDSHGEYKTLQNGPVNRYPSKERKLELIVQLYY